MGATDIRSELSRFLRVHPQIAKSRLGRDAVNDPALVDDVLRGGRMLSSRVASRVRAYIASREGR